MVQKLADSGTVIYEKYGMIVLSKKGEQMGGTLLERHQIIEDFLKLLGNTRGILEPSGSPRR
jgi:Mn-dependent DtxR family transcriptional regulator